MGQLNSLHAFHSVVSKIGKKKYFRDMKSKLIIFAVFVWGQCVQADLTSCEGVFPPEASNVLPKAFEIIGTIKLTKNDDNFTVASLKYPKGSSVTKESDKSKAAETAVEVPKPEVVKEQAESSKSESEKAQTEPAKSDADKATDPQVDKAEPKVENEKTADLPKENSSSENESQKPEKTPKQKKSLEESSDEQSESMIVSVDKTLFAEGSVFWLVKGTLNLNRPAVEKDILDRTEVQVAYGFKTRSGQYFKLQLQYRPINRNGQRDAILDEVKLLDSYGQKVKITPGPEALIQKSYGTNLNDLAALDIDGAVIPFKVLITAAEREKYQAFFKDYFENSTMLNGKQRSMTVKDDMSTAQDMQAYLKRLKYDNFGHFIIKRGARVVVSAAIQAAAIGGLLVAGSSMLDDSQSTSPAVEAPSSASPAESTAATPESKPPGTK